MTAVDSKGLPDGPAVVAGIDEAGLGPMLGPLALGWCALRVPRANLDPWQDLKSAVAERHSRGERRLVVADSKQVFDRSPRGWNRLEATALSFLGCLKDARMPADGWQLARTPPARWAPTDAEFGRHPWYERLDRKLPLKLERPVLEEHVLSLHTVLEAADVQVVEAGVRLVPAGELNDSFAWTLSKGRTAWTHVANILEHLLEQHGDEPLFVHLDRQGGRTRYAALLQESFPLCTVRTLLETPEDARYVLDVASKRLTLRVTPRAEDESFSVAVASCLAKYGREVSMEAFNDFFGAHQEGLRPTAGYVTDARRWLAEAGPALSRAEIAPERLIRQR